MKIYAVILAVASVLPTMAVAQTTEQVAAPAVAAPTVVEATKLVLPPNTEVAVTPNDNLTTKGTKEGDTFLLSTVFDVMYNGYVVIPRGTPGQGTIVWRSPARARSASRPRWSFSSTGSISTGVAFR